MRTETHQPPNAATGKADPKSGMLIEFIINKLIVRSKINLDNTFPPSLSPSQLSGGASRGAGRWKRPLWPFSCFPVTFQGEQPESFPCPIVSSLPQETADLHMRSIICLIMMEKKKILPLLEGETLMTKLSDHARAAGSQTDGRVSLSPQAQG